MKRLTTIVAAGICLAIATGPADALAHQGRHRRGHDQQGSGTVESFSARTRSLTVRLADKSTLVGRITGRTQIKCVAAGSAHAADHGGRDQTSSGSGDQSGSGEAPGSSDDPQTAANDPTDQNDTADQNDTNDQNETADQNDTNDQNETADQNDANEQGDNNGQNTVPNQTASNGNPSCGVGELQAGTVVMGARLRMRHDGESFDQIRLAL